METVLTISWIIAISIAIIYTYFTFKTKSKEMFDGLFIMWFAMIMLGWILGFVFLGVVAMFWIDSKITVTKN